MYLSMMRIQAVLVSISIRLNLLILSVFPLFFSATSRMKTFGGYFEIFSIVPFLFRAFLARNYSLNYGTGGSFL